MKAATLLVVLLCCHVCLSHVCMVYPEQRGGYNVSAPAEGACYQPHAPCGSHPTEFPKKLLRGGQLFNVLIQQNLNHYNVGNPGYLQISWAYGSAAAPNSHFTPLAVIPDYWAHFQATQTDFSIPVTIPNINCDHCTIQVLYNPNKPTEPVFYQCSDIAIVATPDQPLVGYLHGIAKVGSASAVTNSYSTFVTIDYQNGAVDQSYTHFTFGQRSLESTKALFDEPTFVAGNGLLGADDDGDILFFGQSYGDIMNNQPLTSLFHLNLLTGNMQQGDAPLPENVVSQWVSILNTEDVVDGFGQAVLGQYKNASSGVYTYSLFWLGDDGDTQKIGDSSPMDSTFVNFIWATYSICANKVYVLSGDENNLYQLDAKLITFDLTTGYESSVLIDNSQFTISDIFSDDNNGNCMLKAVSPGLVDDADDQRVYSLVTIDPATGAVTNPVGLSKPGEFALSYDGGILGNTQSMHHEGIFFHKFKRSVDQSDELRTFDNAGKTLTSTSLGLGVNQMVSIDSLIYGIDA